MRSPRASVGQQARDQIRDLARQEADRPDFARGRRAGFAVERLEEFSPTAEQVEADPALAEERERPMFLLVAARRR